MLIEEAGCRFRAVSHVHLLVDVADVNLHGILGKMQLVGDDLVLRPLADEIQDLNLPGGQSGDAVAS